jgi:hypothetical protein
MFENTALRVEQGGAKLVVGSGATIDFQGGAVTANGVQASAIADLAVSVGTADGTIADVGGAFNQTTLNNNFRDLADKYNTLLAACRGAGIIAGT